MNDISSAHTPLIGLPTSFSGTAVLPYTHLGEFHRHPSAVPVRLLGVTRGLLPGMGLLILTWFTTATWPIRRRVGHRTGLLGCVVGASPVRTLGSQVLIDPTPVEAGGLAFFALCAAAWTVATAGTFRASSSAWIRVGTPWPTGPSVVTVRATAA